MLTQSYNESDLKSLTIKARTLWEYDFISTPKKIKRRENVAPDKVPLKAIYRMVAEDWAKPEFNCYYYPFSTSGFSSVIGLAEGWEIPVEDRKYIEKNMVLIDSDSKTILISPEKKARWWETTWFNAVSLIFGVIGFISLFF